jgi:ATP-dependent Clp protease ATP-binding subunit ClpA
VFSSIKQRFKDMKTISALCSTAEFCANAVGQQEPGAEHFLLAALSLPDGSARRAFERIGANPQQFSAAIEQQYREALQSIGLDASRLEDEASAAVS